MNKDCERLVLDAVLDGQLLQVVEYRAGMASVKKHVEPEGGKAIQGKVMVRHLVEIVGSKGFESMLVLEFLPETVTDPETVKIPWEKGRRYAFPISKMNRENGKATAFLDSKREVIPL